MVIFPMSYSKSCQLGVHEYGVKDGGGAIIMLGFQPASQVYCDICHNHSSIQRLMMGEQTSAFCLVIVVTENRELTDASYVYQYCLNTPVHWGLKNLAMTLTQGY